MNGYEREIVGRLWCTTTLSSLLRAVQREEPRRGQACSHLVTFQACPELGAEGTEYTATMTGRLCRGVISIVCV